MFLSFLLNIAYSDIDIQRAKELKNKKEILIKEFQKPIHIPGKTKKLQKAIEKEKFGELNYLQENFENVNKELKRNLNRNILINENNVGEFKKKSSIPKFNKCLWQWN